MKRVLIYGVGHNCEWLFKYGDLSNVNVIGFVDQKKYGENYRGKKIIHPEQVRDDSFDDMLVTPFGSDEIIADLCNKYGFDKRKLKNAGEINREYILSRVKNKKYVFFELVGVFESIYREVLDRQDTINICFLKDEKDWLDDVEKGIEIDSENRVFIFAINMVKDYYPCNVFRYLRLYYKNSKQVMIFYDQIEGEHGLKNRFSFFDVDNLKESMDKLLTYHRGDSLKYEIEYRDMVYSDLSDEMPFAEIMYDIAFVGYAKNRLEKIYAVYDRLSAAGYRCNFWLVGVDKEQQRNEVGLKYVGLTSYEEYLRLLAQSRAVLEVCDEGDESTLRYYESVLYHKKLLTDDKSVLQKKYFNKANMYYYSCAEDIQPEWLKEPMEEYNYGSEYSPDKLLDYLNCYVD
jgi:hypothetical protein